MFNLFHKKPKYIRINPLPFTVETEGQGSYDEKAEINLPIGSFYTAWNKTQDRYFVTSVYGKERGWAISGAEYERINKLLDLIKP